ncbi:cation transporter [Bombiscardovia apis]|uniref:Cation transporter n=2 Tax=Bombiscardovia apis TaxID=2932182 RepID=A0ABN6SGI0_9BIFI|nr:cation diffusion facilitator family transporter [Bombiscardovia apis]BDR54382.1 cation transporter [Bombiscardovia apis]
MLTLSFSTTVFLVEVVGAILTNSLALLVDAAHMLTDIAMLAAATVTAILMQRKPTSKRTWGWARLEVLTAALGSMVLFVVGIYAVIEAGLRLFSGEAEQVKSPSFLLFFGAVGVAANLCSLLILYTQRSDNLNMKAAFLEVMNDALGSFAVVISAAVMLITGWGAFDSIAGGVIAIMMVPRAASLFLSSVKILLEETPSELDVDQVREHLERVPGVVAVHDLHANTVASGMPQLSAHVTVKAGSTMEESGVMLAKMQDCLLEHFPVSIEHTTFQIEPADYKERHSEHLDM